MDWQKYASTINTVVATAAIVISGVWAFVEYRRDISAERERAAIEATQLMKAQRFEAAKPFLQKQLDLCIEASDAAATLAAAQDPERIAVARDRFWELYLGSLHIVEDTGTDSVAGRMVEFGSIVQTLPSDSNVLAAMDVDRRGLRSPSLEIARACRRLIERSWRDVVPQFREG